jgi:hypothetical protein
MPIAKLPNGGSVTESHQIVLRQIQLDTLPAYTPVTISGMAQVEGMPGPGQFTVNYQNGILTFNQAQNGLTKSVTYAQIQDQLTNSEIVEKVNELVDGVNNANGAKFYEQKFEFTAESDGSFNGVVTPTHAPVGILNYYFNDKTAGTFNSPSIGPILSEADALALIASGNSYYLVYLKSDGTFRIFGNPSNPPFAGSHVYDLAIAYLY